VKQRKLVCFESSKRRESSGTPLIQLTLLRPSMRASLTSESIESCGNILGNHQMCRIRPGSWRQEIIESYNNRNPTFSCSFFSNPQKHPRRLKRAPAAWPPQPPGSIINRTRQPCLSRAELEIRPASARSLTTSHASSSSSPSQPPFLQQHRDSTIHSDSIMIPS
jgi:hypothetical protein